MRLGIDIDNVLYDWDGAARAVLLESDIPENLTFPQQSLLRNKSTAWDSVEQIVGPKNWAFLWDAADETGLFLRQKPDATYQASLSATSLLSEKHDVYLITSRPRRYAWQTFEWLAGLYPRIQARGVIHWANKAKLAAALELQVVVDDKAEILKSYVLKASSSKPRGLYVYGVRQPWNRHFKSLYYRFKWVDNLGELLPEQERWAA